MLCDFENEILNFARSEQLFGGADPGAPGLVAVSGGADSIALLQALWSFKADRHIGSEMICVHLNHRLRGTESETDEAFVVSQASGLGLDIVIRRLDVKEYAARDKLSIETAARKWRIETLCEIAKARGAAYIATGHHKNDNAETMIQRFLRGTGFRGLVGIRPKHRFNNGACFVRPLLCVTRDQIQQYLKARNLTWREDSSNRDVEFRRNFIRHSLLPEIQRDCSGPIVEQLWELSCRMRRFQDYLQRQAEPIWHKLAQFSDGRVGIDLRGFQAQSEPIKIELIRRTVQWLGSGEAGFTEGHFGRINDLANQNVSNRTIELPDGLRLRREYKKLIFAASRQIGADGGTARGEVVELNIPGRTRFGGYVIESCIKKYDAKSLKKFKVEKDNSIEWFDYDKLIPPLTIRFRRDGDRFTPLGMKAEKKIADFLSDAQVPHDIRSEVLIVSDAEKILWIQPIRLSDRVKVTDSTKRIIEIQIRPST
jgi:tRNA(Ile)-lysidine synthase